METVPVCDLCNQPHPRCVLVGGVVQHSDGELDYIDGAIAACPACMAKPLPTDRCCYVHPMEDRTWLVSYVCNAPATHVVRDERGRCWGVCSEHLGHYAGTLPHEVRADVEQEGG